jgi:hypothetical protein
MSQIGGVVGDVRMRVMIVRGSRRVVLAASGPAADQLCSRLWPCRSGYAADGYRCLVKRFRAGLKFCLAGEQAARARCDQRFAAAGPDSGWHVGPLPGARRLGLRR